MYRWHRRPCLCSQLLKAYSLDRKANNEKALDGTLILRHRRSLLDPNFAAGYIAVGGDCENLGEVGLANAPALCFPSHSYIRTGG
jgi:hypothetical protein